MSLGHLCTLFHPISFPEFLLHMQTKYLHMISLLFFILKNTFNKICIFLRQVKYSERKGQNNS